MWSLASLGRLGGLAALALLAACGGMPSTEKAAATILADELPSSRKVFTGRELSSLRAEGHVAAHVVLNGEGRPALVPAEPSSLSFAVDIPEKPELRFAIAAVPASSEAFEAEFRVLVRTSRGREQAFREVIGPRHGRRWIDRTVDLTAWSETAMEVVLETKRLSGEAGVFTIWGNPVITSRPETRRPHLILVSVDCLRADHMGVYGYPRPTTPHVDRFAERSVVFERAVASSPWTVPSHYTMFTGLPPSFHGVAAHPNAIWGGTAALLSEAVSYLPEVLARGGYETHAVVTSAPVSTAYGFHRGFSTFRELSPDAAGAVDAALRTLSRASEREQFLFLHLIDPHAPYLPKVEFQSYSKRYIERFGPRPDDISGLASMVSERRPPGDEGDVRGVEQLYDAAVAYVDEHLGHFFRELDRSGVLARSVVIVTGDHGEAFYDHGVWQHGETLYRDVLDVPLIVRWPDTPPGRSVAPVSLVDIAPTFLAAAGMERIASEGQSLDELVRARSRDNPRATASEVNLVTPDGTRTLVSFEIGSTKYIATLDGAFDETAPDRLISEELYDLSVDPGESEPLTTVDEDVRRDFRELLRAYLARGRRLRALWGEGARASPDDETLRELEALGYIH